MNHAEPKPLADISDFVPAEDETGWGDDGIVVLHRQRASGEPSQYQL